MSNKTTNYSLTLPLQEEYYNVDVFNENNSVIDSELKRLSNGIESLSKVATSGNYNDLSNKPELATVATSGNYNDLSDKPNTVRGAKVYTINSDTFAGGRKMDNNPYAEIHDCNGRIVYVGLLNPIQEGTAHDCGLYVYNGSGSQGEIGIQVTSMPTMDIKLVVVDLGAYDGTEEKAVVIDGLNWLKLKG